MSDTSAPTGDVTGEYLQIRSEVGSIAGLHRMLRVSGPDAVTFLQGLVSQDLLTMEPGTVKRSFFLQPNGKLASLLWAGVGSDEVLLFCDADVALETERLLARYRIRVKADIELDERPVHELWGPGSFAASGIEPDSWQRRGDNLIVAAGLGVIGRVFVVGEPPAAPAVGTLAITSVRVEAGEPVMGIDVDTSTIPQECGFIDESVSFTKGCYLGQELVARIDTRGHVNRHLMGVLIHNNTVPPDDAELVVGDRIVGRLTSPTESLTLRACIGLSLVRREVGHGDSVEVRWTFDGATTTVPASVRDLPLDDFTKP